MGEIGGVGVTWGSQRSLRGPPKAASGAWRVSGRTQGGGTVSLTPKLSPPLSPPFQLRTLRGSVLEEALPPGCRPPGARGVPPRKLLELLLPGLAVGGLRLAPSPAVQDTLLKLDEQGVREGLWGGGSHRGVWGCQGWVGGLAQGWERLQGGV